MKKNLYREKTPNKKSIKTNSTNSPISFYSKSKSSIKATPSPNRQKQKSFPEQTNQFINNEINSLWNQYNSLLTTFTELQINDFDLSFRMFLYKYDITKHFNFSLISLNDCINIETEIILSNEKTWLMHIFILVNKYNINLNKLIKIYDDIFIRFSFTKNQYELIFKQFLSFISENDLQRILHIIPKQFSQFIITNDKSTKLEQSNEKIKQSYNKSKNLNNNEYIHKNSNELLNINTKYILNEIKNENLTKDASICLTQFAVFEGNTTFVNKTGHKCAFTPIKKNPNKNKVKEEQEKLKEIYGDEGIYIPFNKDILNTINKTKSQSNVRFTFGTFDSILD